MAFRKMRRGLVGALVLAVTSGTLLTAAPAQAVRPVEPYAPYQGQVSCDPVAKRGTLSISRALMKKFGGRSLGISRACGTGGSSEHKEGRAFDWGLNANKASDRKRAANGIKWMTETVHGVPGYRAKRRGVMYIIWNKKMWRAYDAAAGWKPYKGWSPHTDHVHVSLSWSGAMKSTSQWTKTPRLDYGPCRPWANELAKPWKAPRLTPCPEALKRPVADAKGYYVAQNGETVERVAKFFKITPAQVRAWNNFPATGEVRLYRGQKILVKAPVITPAARR